MALGFWVLGINKSRRMLIGLLFKTWVRASRGSLELKNGKAANIRLFKASYGS